MKLFLKILFTLVLIFSFAPRVVAAESYTLGQVSQHNKPSDCWMIINNNVYDLSDYLEDHDKELDIRSWCGTDATADYADKAGMGKSHSSRADNLLDAYLIGSLIETRPTISNEQTVESQTTTPNIQNPVPSENKYNLFFPLFGTIIFYLLSLKFLKRQTHNFIWNSIMLLGLIPALVFGVIMVLAKEFTWAYSIKYADMLYHHVEFSIVFGTTCALHFLNRIRVYVFQGKNTLKKETKI